MTERLPARVEVAAMIRRVQAGGGFATVLHSGDLERGAISLLVVERGDVRAVLERRMAPDFSYRWTEVSSAKPGADWRDWVRQMSRIDPDCWLVELDVADAQRFIAETTAAG